MLSPVNHYNNINMIRRLVIIQLYSYLNDFQDY